MKLFLKEANDAAADRVRLSGTLAGSKNIRVMRDGPVSVVSSIDPSGPNGEDEAHVSVSYASKPVSDKTAIEIASQLIMEAKNWRCEHVENCTHVYGDLTK